MVGYALLIAAFLSWALFAPPLAQAQIDETAATASDYDDVLGGFDEEPTSGHDDAPASDIDDALGGFDDELPSEYDDALGGFDDSEATTGGSALSTAGTEEDARPTYDLTGNVSLGSSLNIRPHRASVGPDPEAEEGTYYGGIQRLRLRGDLQLDLHQLPFDWKARAQGFIFYDFAYLLNGRNNYTDGVLDDYEWQAEVLDFWIEGSVLDNLDLRLGRQVVNWGRSDTLRVNDVLNPLNNREPGLVDIEDLRLPVTMAKADYYWGPWSITAILVPEIRYDYDPPVGSDFFPVVSFDDLPALGLPANFDSMGLILQAGTLAYVELLRSGLEEQGRSFLAQEPARKESDQWGSPPEFAGSISGIFSGWDISLYWSYTYQNRASTVINLADFSTPIPVDDNRIVMVGAGSNYTVGSWLLKAELAYLDDLSYQVLVPDWSLCPINNLFDIAGHVISLCLPMRADTLTKSRLDTMLGVEYYGISDFNIALEVAYRHLFDYDPILQYLPNYLHENNVEIALRLGYDMMNTRLKLSALGLSLLSEAGHHGSTMRLSASYELTEALTMSGGLLYFFEGEGPPFDSWADNDRLFLKLKYSF